MKYLGIDYGTKRIGLALSDEEGRMAFPLEVVSNDSKLFTALENVIKENDVKKVVLGESKNYKMEDNAIMKDILELKDIIEKTMDIDVELQPEFMTSVEAEKFQGKNVLVDASAAAIILQSYLDIKKK